MKYIYLVCLGLAENLIVQLGLMEAVKHDESIDTKVMKKQLSLIHKHIVEIKNEWINYESNFTQQLKPPPTIIVFKDCHQIYKEGHTRSGVYNIHIFRGFISMPIYCDMETIGAFSAKKGWMTIQRRLNGEVNFDRGWHDYVHGFGFPDKEHWVGLRTLLQLTKQRLVGEYDIENLILRIDIEDFDGKTAFMEHDSFSLLSEDLDFAISNLGRYRGSSGLMSPMGFSLYSPFSTHDHNTDRRRTQECVKDQRGGWWFGSCNNINLNGLYPMQSEEVSRANIFIRNWAAINNKNTAIRSVSVKLQ